METTGRPRECLGCERDLSWEERLWCAACLFLSPPEPVQPLDPSQFVQERRWIRQRSVR